MKNLNRKGQALVEFVIILPIVLMIIFVIIDFSNVFYQKNHLESVIDSVVSYKEKGKSYNEIKSLVDEDIELSYSEENSILVINIKKNVNLITPFSSMFFDNPYTISTERAIIYD